MWWSLPCPVPIQALLFDTISQTNQVLSTKLEMSEQKVAKGEAELERIKTSLREAREEVQNAARESANAVSRAEHKKLLVEVGR